MYNTCNNTKYSIIHNYCINNSKGEWDHPQGWGSHSPHPFGFFYHGTHTHTHIKKIL